MTLTSLSHRYKFWEHVCSVKAAWHSSCQFFATFLKVNIFILLLRDFHFANYRILFHKYYYRFSFCKLQIFIHKNRFCKVYVGIQHTFIFLKRYTLRLKVYFTKVYLKYTTFSHLKSILEVYFTTRSVLWLYFQEVYCLGVYFKYTSRILIIFIG